MIFCLLCCGDLPSKWSRLLPRIWSLIRFVPFGTLSACRIPTDVWSKWPGPDFGTCELQYTWKNQKKINKLFSITTPRDKKRAHHHNNCWSFFSSVISAQNTCNKSTLKIFQVFTTSLMEFLLFHSPLQSLAGHSLRN